MKITFSPNTAWSFDRESVLLNAQVDGKSVLCVIPQEYLTYPLAVMLDGPKAQAIFQQRRQAIESELRQRIIAGQYNQAGEIILRSPSA